MPTSHQHSIHRHVARTAGIIIMIYDGVSFPGRKKYIHRFFPPSIYLTVSLFPEEKILTDFNFQGASDEVIKERGQVIACINMLGLNNELFRSHVDLKRRLVEMCVQAVLSDFVSDKSQASSNPESAAVAEHVMQWAYDLIVLDPYGNFGKKVNEPLLGREKRKQ